MSNSNFVPVGGEFTFAGKAFTAIERDFCDFCIFWCMGRCLRPDSEDVDLKCCDGRPDGKRVVYVYSELVDAIKKSLT